MMQSILSQFYGDRFYLYFDVLDSTNILNSIKQLNNLKKEIEN